MQMASRNVCRRLIQASLRLNIRRSCSQLPRGIHNISKQKLPSDLQCSPCSYSQIRALCCKSGEGLVVNIQNHEDFEKRVMNSPLPVVLDFHANWCGPCKLLGPRLESLVLAKEGKVILAKIDVDKEELFDIVTKYKIQSVPTVIAITNKKTTEKFIGMQDDDVIETFLEKLVG